MDATELAIASTIATAVAAVATAASAVVIAFQTKATNRAAEASEEAVSAANGSLAEARAQTQHSLFMAAESVKARLDTQTPRLSLTVEGDKRSWLYLTSTTNSPSMQLTEVAIGHTFNSPQENEIYLWVEVPCTIRNDGPGVAVLRASPAFYSMRSDGSRRAPQQEITIAPGDFEAGVVLVGTTVSGWIEERGRMDRRRNGEELYGAAQGGWSLDLHGSQGVAQYQRLEVRGSILTEVSPGQWQLVGGNDVVNAPANLHVTPVMKTYILDRSKELVLPEILWESLTPTPQADNAT